jgi:hypothetical protein
MSGGRKTPLLCHDLMVAAIFLQTRSEEFPQTKSVKIREMLGAFLVFYWCPPDYNVTFKITNKLKVNNNYLKIKSDFKSHITVGKTLFPDVWFVD